MKWIAGWRIWGILGGILAVIFGVLTIEKNHYKRKAEEAEAKVESVEVGAENREIAAKAEGRLEEIEEAYNEEAHDAGDVVVLDFDD